MKAKVIKTGEMVDVYHEPQHGQVTNIYKESVLVNGRMWSEDELDFCPKPNEAPEKIYIQSFNVSEEDAKFTRKLYFDDVWTEEPESGQENIEYIRTDAFIKKAENYLRNECQRFILTEKDIVDFVKFMKGE